ncbi:splicing factor U2af large subunit A protein [Pleurostoma richardsiae]|uniref:Splicing factor U2af large subunit A protein n=1 Tax=Pleurostoma richardsiae TaxID=41990 RepID=A0AA38RT66_9PEZI|nr:splicing factor U2af large subunit A protein [Pleurostoma richardsiae]
MATGPQAFYCLWQEERIREKLFSLLPKEDICSVRVANSACCNLVTKRLFMRTNLTFTANTFTRPCRIQALSRIGHHVEHLTFHFPHSDATFLPPLIHPLTGHEISYLYTPHTSMASVLARPKYGNSELGDILTQQYPPLFHAATNVPSFINAMKHLPNIRHLTIKTPGQDARERYRRDIVDYALISLRISLERAPMTKLTKLSLSSVHPAAFNYLRHVQGFGCVPCAGKRWKQIRKLYISVDSWDFHGPSPGLDHLKIIDDYIRHFAPQLEKLTFAWLGRDKGPCPLALSGDPLFAPPRNTKKLFNEVTSPMSPLPPTPARNPIFFPRLRYMQVRNAAMTAPQLADLVSRHRGSVREFDFENVVLLNGGSWDDALAPLADGPDASDEWSRSSIVAGSGPEADIPRTPVAPYGDEFELPSPSAAVAAVSRELLNLDVEGLEAFVGLSSSLDGDDSPEEDVIREEDEEDDGGLASDIAAAKEASEGFSTKIKKKRVRRRRRKPWHIKEEPAPHQQTGESRTGFLRRARSHGEKAGSGSSNKTDDHPYNRQRSHSSPTRHRQHRHSYDAVPYLLTREVHASQPEVIGTDDEADFPLPALTTSSSAASFRRPATPPMDISAPMPADPLPVLLQPAVYDPSSSPSKVATAAVMVAGGGGLAGGDGLSAVQRNIEQEEAQRLLAEDAAARTSALRKAKEAVLAKLSREFCRRAGTARGGGNGERAVAAPPPLAPGRYWCRENLFGAVATPDHRSLDSSSSAVVPLIFSRS